MSNRYTIPPGTPMFVRKSGDPNLRMHTSAVILHFPFSARQALCNGGWWMFPMTVKGETWEIQVLPKYVRGREPKKKDIVQKSRGAFGTIAGKRASRRRNMAILKFHRKGG